MNQETKEFIDRIKNEELRKRTTKLVDKTNELIGALSSMYPSLFIQYRLVREDEMLINITARQTFDIMFTVWFVGDSFFWKEGALHQHGEKIIG